MHLEILRYLKTATNDSPYPIITGPTGIGKTSLLNAIFKHLNYIPILISPSPRVHEELFSSPEISLTAQRQILFIDELDVVDKEYNFIDDIFRSRRRIRPFVVFCCCSIYASPLMKYRTACKVFQLSITPTDIYYIIDSSVSRQLRSYDHIIKRYGMDVRSIMNNIGIVRDKDNKGFTIKLDSLYKTAEVLLGRNLRFASRATSFYDHLSLLEEEFDGRLYELCYENFVFHCKGFKKLRLVCETGSELDTLPRRYRLIFYDVVNRLCSSSDRVEIVNNRFLKGQKRMIAQIAHDCLKKCAVISPNTLVSIRRCDYYLIRVLREYINIMDGGNARVDEELLSYLPLLNEFVEKDKLARVKRSKFTYSIIEEPVARKDFRLKFKDGVSMGARMNVGIDNLFD